MIAIQYLDWDTHFFGFPTARILPAGLAQDQLERLLRELRANGTKLVYWSTPFEAPFNMNTLGGRLVDRKTTFTIDLTFLKPRGTSYLPPVHEYRSGTADGKLYDLALQSGEHSRFARDPQFPHEKFQALYHEWMRKSLTHELADAILVTGGESQPTGMVTVSAKEGHGEIGLIAVDAASRGKHCGEALVRAAQRWYEERGLKSAQVVTQGDNLPACQLYRKCGYTIGKVEYFYHFWL